MDDMNWYEIDTTDGRVKFQWDTENPNSRMWAILDNGEEEFTLTTPYKFEDAKDVIVAAKLILQYHDLRMTSEVNPI